MKISAIIRGYIQIEFKTVNSKYNELKQMLVYEKPIEFEANEFFGIREIYILRNNEKYIFNEWLAKNSREVKGIDFKDFAKVKGGFNNSTLTIDINNSEDILRFSFPGPLLKLNAKVKILKIETKKIKVL